MWVLFNVVLVACAASTFSVLSSAHASSSTFTQEHIPLKDPVHTLQVIRSQTATRHSAHLSALKPQARSQSSNKPRRGLTYEICNDDDDCADDRTCRFFAGSTPPCAGSTPCRCLFEPPQLMRPCFLDSDCPSGEICANTLILDEPVCVSEKIPPSSPVVMVAGAKPTGLSFDGCRKDTDCAGDRSCQQPSRRSQSPFPACEPALGASACACLPKNVDSKGFKCFTSADCGGGEVCARTPFTDVTVCTSRNAETSYYGFSEVPKPGVCPVRIPIDRPQNARQAMRSFSVSQSSEGGRDPFSMQETVQASSRIVGGDLASQNLQRYMVAMLRLEGGLCSGTLISDRWLLSAGHCNITKDWVALVGVSQVSGDGGFINVSRVFTHPRFFAKRGIRQLRYDISVVELEKPAPSGSKFMELSGDPIEPKKGSNVRAIGYGSPYYFNANTEGFVLRQVDITVADFETCRNDWKGLLSLSPKTNICSDTKNNCSPCGGDSGSPLIFYKNGKPTLTGVHTAGRRCGSLDEPTVAVRISGNLGWLRGTPAEFIVS